MVLRPEAIRERLLRLEEVISRLEELRRLDARALREAFREAWAVERGLQLGAEIVLDVGNHIRSAHFLSAHFLSAHFGVSAQDYEDIITQLGVHNVIGASLREELKGLGGFRNILVHGYLRVDPDRVATPFKSVRRASTSSLGPSESGLRRRRGEPRNLVQSARL
jgi:uncharacterized protein YutE (UPF0331/DUF86 family)